MAVTLVAFGSLKRRAGGATGKIAILTSCCNGNEAVTKELGCDNDKAGATGCCSKANPSLTSSETCEEGCCDIALESEAPGECKDECCDVMDNRSDAETSTTACSTYMNAAFQKFGALVKQQMCICRRVVQQMGFGCCLLSPDGSVS